MKMTYVRYDCDILDIIYFNMILLHFNAIKPKIVNIHGADLSCGYT